jgi:hypothetical protein
MLKGHSDTITYRVSTAANLLLILYGFLMMPRATVEGRDMERVLSFRASGMRTDELRQTLAVYLALDRARIVRRALGHSFGALAAIAGSTMTIAHLFSPVIRIIAIGVCLLPPVGAWIAELGLQHRLFREIERAGLSSRLLPTPFRKKVVKSS